ncbi:c-type cytochrome [Roseovarius tolerans]|nr:cytochrome c [Roseovarius tolerans]
MQLRMVLAAITLSGAASAQNIDVQNGQDLFLYFCAECHGKDAESIGPMAEMLAIDTPELTTLAERNEGEFPAEAVAKQIDGRLIVANHGDMPIFGPYLETAQSVAIKLPSGQPMMVTQHLADLIAYLKTIQTERH